MSLSELSKVDCSGVLLRLAMECSTSSEPVLAIVDLSYISRKVNKKVGENYQCVESDDGETN